MTFVEAVTTCMQKKYATFSGRASRSEFWFFMLFYIIAAIALSIIGGVLEQPLVMVLILGLILPGLAVQIRRLHDVGRSGWFIFINIVPVVGPFILLYWMVQAGPAESNEYGPSPLGAPLAGMPPAAA